MASALESRTVTTYGTFEYLHELLKAETQDSIIANITLENHHHHHPHRSPQQREDTDIPKCPHEFTLCRRKKTLAMARAPTRKSHLLEEEELVVHLGDSVRAMYSEWNMKWEFHVDRESKPRVMIGQPTTVTPHSGSAKWKTITVGRWMEVKKLLEAPGANWKLHFKVVWFCEDPVSLLNSTQQELDHLKIAVTQIGTTIFETSKCPSMDITHLVFRSKRSGSTKHLYVASHILTKFEYFQTCHSAEYSETQPADDTQLKMKGCSVADSKSQEVNETHLRADQTANSEGVYCDDSDDGWDSDSDNVEPNKTDTFKTTIRVKDTSRRTYRAFINYASTRALYFAPLRSAYTKYCNTFYPSLTSRTVRLTQGRRTPWPEWAEAHCTPHTVVPGFRVLSSPKSLYRLADMLIIPELKAICYKQIVKSLDVRYVISEIYSSVFQEHEELRVAAYKFMRKNWKSYESKDIASFIKDLSQEEAELVSEHILKHLTVGTYH